LQAIADHSSLSDGPWADLGTGSGALALGLANLLRCFNADASVQACICEVESAEVL
jgi:methylase of polypeptide subunit release factors